MQLNLAHLRAVMPGLTLAQATKYLPFIQASLDEFGISSRLRVCAFLAQVAHETHDLKYQQEIWGPTPAQKRYDIRTDLGNTPGVDGDGYKYRGRGALQLTGAANYRSVGKALGVDLFADPDRADDVDVSFRIAGYFWRSHKLNDVADKLRGVANANEVAVLTKITKVINGGRNGLEDRIARYNRALRAIPENAPEVAPSKTIRESETIPSGEPARDLSTTGSAAVVATANTANQHDKFQALITNESVRTKAVGFLPGLWGYIARPFLLLGGALKAHSALAISGTVLVVALLIVLAILYRKDLKRAANWIEDQVRRYFLKQVTEPTQQ